MSTIALELPYGEITKLCVAHDVAELSIFGSGLTDRLRPESDLDFLVVFAHPETTGIRRYAAFQLALSRLVGRDVDLVPKDDLRPAIRERVLASAQVIYAAR
jgi:predicted nucleotidyltransferase